MANRHKDIADLGGGITVPYTPVVRNDRGRWELQFNGPDGKRKRILTDHEVRAKTPPNELKEDAVRLLTPIFRPPSLFPSIARKTWDELLAEVQATGPHIRPETIRSFRTSIRAFKEIMPEVESPLDVTEERAKRWAKLWLAAPISGSRAKSGKARSPVTLSYYLRALSAFTNHLVTLEYCTRNVWHGLKAPKAEKTRKPVPSEDQTQHFFTWAKTRFPDWTAFHALVELKAISASRTADICQLKTAQLRDGELTFTPDIVKTKEARSLPLPDDLFQTLKAVAGKVWLWEGLFLSIPKYRKQSNGLPDEFDWNTIYYVVNNIFREYSDEHPDQPRFTPHALRRRAITATVAATGSVDAAATAIGIHSQTARAHYLDAQQAFQTKETMRLVADALRPKKPEQSATNLPPK